MSFVEAAMGGSFAGSVPESAMTAVAATSPWPLVVLGAIPLCLLVLASIRRSPRAAYAITLGGFALAALATRLALPFPVATAPLLSFDPMGGFFVSLFIVAAAAVALFARVDLARRTVGHEEFDLLLAAATLGACVLVVASHFASFVLGLEILSISLYGLIAYHDEVGREEGSAAVEAALKYMILSGVATATLLFGMALLYAACGSMDFDGLGRALALRGDGSLVLVAHTLIFAGLAFKLSLVPFHMWTPDVYQGGTEPVTGFLASVAKAAALVGLIRYLDATGALGHAGLLRLAGVLGVASMLIGNLLALRQRALPRLLAYSSIAHMGYLLIALPLLASGPGGHALAREATMIYLGVYVLTTVGAFGVVGLLGSGDAKPAGSDSAGDVAGDVAGHRGLFWRRPLLAAAFAVFLSSAAGLPLTAGFISKLFLVSAGVEAGLWPFVAALLVGSAIGVAYYLRVVMEMLAGAQTAPAPARDPDRSVALPVFVIAAIAAVILYLGVQPTPLVDLVRAPERSASPAPTSSAVVGSGTNVSVASRLKPQGSAPEHTALKRLLPIWARPVPPVSASTSSR